MRPRPFHDPSPVGGPTQREQELGAIICAYNEVTDRLKVAHERLHSEVARLRDELHRKNEALRRGERLAALGEMAAGLAHEIRNPLGGIALYASLLEGQLAGTSGPARDAAGRISRGVRSLEQLVREILDFAQEDRLERAWCRLEEPWTGADTLARPWADQSHVRVTAEAAALALPVYCDPARLQRVLVNLVMNGIQAAGEGGSVHLSARRTGGGVEITVEDSGPGIAAENLARIFNPFFTTRASGTGLGLAICHRIIEAHGGTIRAGNAPGGGARFVIRLPPGGQVTAEEPAAGREGCGAGQEAWA
jgi:signal transduction histidine kinase